MVEQRSPKPRAEGSSPSAPAKGKEVTKGGFFSLRKKRKDLKRTPRGVQRHGDWENSPVDCSIAEKKVLLPLPRGKKSPKVASFFISNSLKITAIIHIVVES